MQTQIINTHTIKKELMEMSYQVPDGVGISEIKLVVNNYEWRAKEDTIIIWTVWEKWWYYDWWVLKWIQTWAVVTQDDKDQRQLFRWTLKDYERYVEDQLHLWSGDQIWVRSSQWYCNLVVYWRMDPQQDRVDELKNKVVAWTATTSEKEELALLTWWIYVVQNNTNNCSCS